MDLLGLGRPPSRPATKSYCSLSPQPPITTSSRLSLLKFPYSDARLQTSQNHISVFRHRVLRFTLRNAYIRLCRRGAGLSECVFQSFPGARWVHVVGSRR